MTTVYFSPTNRKPLVPFPGLPRTGYDPRRRLRPSGRSSAEVTSTQRANDDPPPQAGQRPRFYAITNLFSPGNLLGCQPDAASTKFRRMNPA